jgi:plastocyanin
MKLGEENTMSIYTEPPGVNGRSDAEVETPTVPPTGPSDSPGKDRAWREWMMIGLGIVGLLSIMATIISVVALSSSSSAPGPSRTAAAAAGSAPAQIAPVLKPEHLTIAVKADDQHGRRGPDGQWHDAFLPADFSVRAGHEVTITINNYDGSPHSFTSPAMGVNQVISGGGSLGAPSTVKFTFKAPSKPGKYAWWCAVPCDPWAMAHDGYMRGYVTVTA